MKFMNAKKLGVERLCMVCKQPTRSRRCCKPPIDKSPRKKGYDSSWDRRSVAYRKKHPFCELCLKTGRLVETNLTDHIKPKAQGGTDDDDNLQALCFGCHGKKTRDEQRQKNEDCY